jgi:hypothetical protein
MEAAMKQVIEVTALRVGALLKDICAQVDFEVVSLPGGSLIAIFFSLYAIAMGSIRRHLRQGLATFSQTTA